MKNYDSLDEVKKQCKKIFEQVGFSTAVKQIKKQKPELFNDPQRKDPTPIRQQVVNDGGEPPEADG